MHRCKDSHMHHLTTPHTCLIAFNRLHLASQFFSALLFVELRSREIVCLSHSSCQAWSITSFCVISVAPPPNKVDLVHLCITCVRGMPYTLSRIILCLFMSVWVRVCAPVFFFFVRWGDWSDFKAAWQHFCQPSLFTLLSGDCIPVSFFHGIPTRSSMLLAACPHRR